MKYLYSRSKILEALRDELLDKQKSRVIEVWGEKWLDKESATPTDKIETGKWKLSEEDRVKVINKFFNTDIQKLEKFIESIPPKFWEDMLSSLVEFGQYDDLERECFENFDITDLKFNQLCILLNNNFKKINMSETLSDTIVLREPNGRPIKDEDGKIQKIKKKEEDKGKLILSSNVCNIYDFATDWCIIHKDNVFEYKLFTDNMYNNLKSLFDDGVTGSFSLFDKKPIYLYISHEPKDILNMSVSAYFKSCQELYHGGGHGESYMRGLLFNVFDPNTCPAFIVYDEPYILNGEKLSDNMPICRLLIRNVIDEDGDSLLYYDKGYPDRMWNLLSEIIDKYTKNKGSNDDIYSRNYDFYVDLDEKDIKDVSTPYHDKLEPNKIRYIGNNSTEFIFKSDDDYKKINLVNPDKCKSIVIETIDLPSNFKVSNFKNLLSTTIRYINFSDINIIQNAICSNLNLYKCRIDNKNLDKLSDMDKIKRLSIISCKILNLEFLSNMNNLEVLELKYLGGLSLPDLSKLKLKEISVSQDIYVKNKEMLDLLSKSGVDIKKSGLYL